MSWRLPDRPTLVFIGRVRRAAINLRSDYRRANAGVSTGSVGQRRPPAVRVRVGSNDVNTQMSINYSIESAADHMDLIPTVAAWHWREWGNSDPQGSLESWTSGLLTRTNRDRIPSTLLALAGSEPVGSVTLVEHDMPDRADLAELTPWLAGLYVAPDRRHQGVASALIARCEDLAAQLGVSRLYLYTAHADRLYQQVGWSVSREVEYRGNRVTIMTKDLSRTTDRHLSHGMKGG